MLKQHGVGRAELWNFVKTAAYEVPCGLRETFMGKVWGFSIDDGLFVGSEKWENQRVVQTG